MVAGRPVRYFSKRAQSTEALEGEIEARDQKRDHTRNGLCILISVHSGNCSGGRAREAQMPWDNWTDTTARRSYGD